MDSDQPSISALTMGLLPTPCVKMGCENTTTTAARADEGSPNGKVVSSRQAAALYSCNVEKVPSIEGQ